MRIVFMGTPEFAVPTLQRLLLNNYPVAAVYTQPDRPAGRKQAPVPSPVKRLAMQWGLPVEQPESLKTPEAEARLAACEPDLVVVAAYGQILTPEILAVPARGTVNVHASLLPRHRGATPVAASLLAGEDITGVSILLVEPRLDAGPVLARAAVSVAPYDNTGTLTAKLAGVGAGLLLEALTGWQRGDIVPAPQDEAQATYIHRISKDAGEIDWKLTAPEIWNRVRAYNPWPGSYTYWKGRQLKIKGAVVADRAERAAPGEVVSLPGPAPVGIGTADGILGLLTVQLEGKRAVSAAEFLRGQREFIGAQLPS